MYKWDFSKLSTVKYESNEHTVIEPYRGISIRTVSADIVLVPSDGSDTTVTCYEKVNVRHTVSVKDGVLVIEVYDTRKWYEHIGIVFQQPKITVSLPEGIYGALQIHAITGDVSIPKGFEFESIDISEKTGDITVRSSVSGSAKISATTGDIRAEQLFAGSLALSVTTGEISVSDVTCTGDLSLDITTGEGELCNIRCRNFTSSGTTGSLSLENLIAEECLSVERVTGDVRLDGVDAAELFIKPSTGSVTGTVLSEKIFLAHASTGRVEVPHTASGGKCEITTSTGNIRIRLP
jgi:DUF4097 and DUF4098 domain-containing protein YvlB